MLQESNISYPVYNIVGMYLDGNMIIFTSLQLPKYVAWLIMYGKKDRFLVMED